MLSILVPQPGIRSTPFGKTVIIACNLFPARGMGQLISADLTDLLGRMKEKVPMRNIDSVKNVNGQQICYQLSVHAQIMMAERGIHNSWIGRVLSKPLALEIDREDIALCHALGRIPERGDKLLRVVYNKTVKPWLVVTAFFDRKAGKIL